MIIPSEDLIEIENKTISQSGYDKLEQECDKLKSENDQLTKICKSYYSALLTILQLAKGTTGDDSLVDYEIEDLVGFIELLGIKDDKGN